MEKCNCDICRNGGKSCQLIRYCEAHDIPYIKIGAEIRMIDGVKFPSYAEFIAKWTVTDTRKDSDK